MSYRDGLRADPYGFDFFQTMREFERSSPAKPRIGENGVLAEEIVSLGQDPFLEFPASNLSGYEDVPNGAPKVRTRFLGYFGPQGALPLSTTVEAHHWSSQRDQSYVHFTDIISNRFLQLFFRVWANARPIAQADRPADDRFIRYAGSLTGVGTDAYLDRDSVADIAKVSFAGLTGSRIKSAVRLRQLVESILQVKAEIEERVGSWLVFEASDQMALGSRHSGLGVDAALGVRAYSINDKIRIRITATSLEQYKRLLPAGELSEILTDLVFYYLGHRFEFDVELGLDARLATPVRLGVSGELGWTSWMTPKQPKDGETIVLRDARFDPMERRREMAGKKPKPAARTSTGARR
ncbi:type VI secretion system baseplate subunit TssG [Mesorhizobium sp. LHD-90]|uniref:type VI secretion system baseplate subunit TssG n=1 Tax=Mesorhizobium sp. LHD-90 TaxID=3071414 RepID=UPI0027E17955|nr:type VI secretion system baseplate subunit TssG [Mesorhizobium sp. LHD-90]MDQ6434711.1 type VI secretion system baseplate subunit TssG [Mesorhizobium sp. LHD-90]